MQHKHAYYSWLILFKHILYSYFNSYAFVVHLDTDFMLSKITQLYYAAIDLALLNYVPQLLMLPGHFCQVI